MKLLKNTFITLLLTLTVFLWCNNLMAQDVEKLPDDPRVKHGSLANGLSYVLIKNGAEKGFAHFGIAQKVGTTLEEEGQKGMFKMIEALTVKGTRNFTDSTILQYLKSLGVKPQDVSFSTREDDVTYLIKNLPVANPNTIDSSLLILYNWLNSINIDEEDMREEAPFVKNSLLYRWDASKRLDDKLLNGLYPGSRYAMNLRMEDVSRIENFTSKELRNFYYKWFRPDFQTIVIVGDIDLGMMETKVKSVFSTIQKPIDKQAREYFTPEPFNGIKVFILKDKEYNKTRVSIDILKEPLLQKYRNTSVPFIQEYMDSAISRLLFARLKDGIVHNGLPIEDLSVGKGNFMKIHNQDAFSITFETLPNMIYSSIAFVNSEIGRMAKYGFNGQELSRSKDIYFRELEKVYDNRAKICNDAYLQKAMDHVYNDATLASIELKFEIMKEILFTISLNQLNQYANAMLGQTDNVVISCRMPEYEGIEGITEERVMASYRDAQLRTPTIEHGAPIVKWPEFTTSQTSSSIVSEVTDPVTDAVVMILSNGATVVYKRNVSDTISFRAVSKGGYSLMSDFNYYGQEYMNDVLNLGGLGNIPQPDLERFFSYYNFKIDAYIGQNTEYLEGYATNGNVEKLFHAINMSMTARRADESAYELYKRSKMFETSYKTLAPMEVFKDSVLNCNHSNRKHVVKMSSEDIAGLDYASLLAKARERFSNAADFVFIFVGNMEMEKYKGLAVKYIGSIPGNTLQKEDWVIVPDYLTKGKLDKSFLCRMINPRSFTNLTLSCGMPYSLDNYVKGKLLDAYMKRVLAQRSSRRHMMQCSINTTLKNYPEQIYVMEVQFEADSMNAKIVKEKILSSMSAIANGSVADLELEAMKIQLKDEFMAENATNDYWLDLFGHRYMAGKDFYSNYMKSLESITVADFKEFALQIAAQGNMVSVTMDGTTKDVNTQNLFKEDEFIKEYFDLNW